MTAPASRTSEPVEGNTCTTRDLRFISRLVLFEKQQENTRQELEKPFAQEQELAEKEARLSAVNALLNIDGKNSIPDLMDDTLDIEPPQRAAKDYER